MWLEKLESGRCTSHQVVLENGYAESFNSRLRDELLNVEQFASVSHARAAATAWREDYNDYRPHGSLCGQSRIRASLCCFRRLRPLQHSEPLTGY